jgi:hypothetical protein
MQGTHSDGHGAALCSALLRRAGLGEAAPKLDHVHPSDGDNNGNCLKRFSLLLLRCVPHPMATDVLWPILSIIPSTCPAVARRLGLRSRHTSTTGLTRDLANAGGV